MMSYVSGDTVEDTKAWFDWWWAINVTHRATPDMWWCAFSNVFNKIAKDFMLEYIYWCASGNLTHDASHDRGWTIPGAAVRTAAKELLITMIADHGADALFNEL